MSNEIFPSLWKDFRPLAYTIRYLTSITVIGAFDKIKIIFHIIYLYLFNITIIRRIQSTITFYATLRFFPVSRHIFYVARMQKDILCLCIFMGWRLCSKVVGYAIKCISVRIYWPQIRNLLDKETRGNSKGCFASLPMLCYYYRRKWLEIQVVPNLFISTFMDRLGSKNSLLKKTGIRKRKPWSNLTRGFWHEFTRCTLFWSGF